MYPKVPANDNPLGSIVPTALTLTVFNISWIVMVRSGGCTTSIVKLSVTPRVELVQKYVVDPGVSPSWA